MSTFPTTPAPSSMSIKSVQPTQVSTSHSLKRNTRSKGGQRWGFALSYANRTRAEWASLFAFAVAQRGQLLAFDFVPAVVGMSRSGAVATAPSTGAVASGRTLPVTTTPGITAGLTGDLIKFANHSKVYMLTADAVANGVGQATLQFEPALYAAVSAGELVTFNNVPIKCAFASDAHESPLEAGGIFSWSCDLVEDLS